MSDLSKPIPRPPLPELRFTDEKAVIPEGYSAPLDTTPTRVLIRKRIEAERAKR